MPANRSRTQRWRECLWQVYERRGALEISVERNDDGSDSAAHDLIWRVKILGVNDQHIVVEQPAAFGKSFPLETGTRLIGAMSIGQNRWMFKTHVDTGGDRSRIRLVMPELVERCQRRSHYRVSAAAIDLPEVECWPLLDPSSVVAAEVANEALVRGHEQGGGEPLPEQLLPDVGPGFTASLVNISGGGLGLLIPPTESSGIERARHLWMRVRLNADAPTPIAMTGRLVHTHMDSLHNVHAGIAFDFGFNPSHRGFVVEQIGRLVNKLQTGQSRRAA